MASPIWDVAPSYINGCGRPIGSQTVLWPISKFIERAVQRRPRTSDRAIVTACQTPDSFQFWKRRRIELQLPYSLGITPRGHTKSGASPILAQTARSCDNANTSPFQRARSVAYLTPDATAWTRHTGNVGLSISATIGKGIEMKPSRMIGLAIGATLASKAACSGETIIVSNVLGPEGPLVVDGNLYYVGWMSDTLSMWNGQKTTVLNHTPGCSHNGLALTKQKTFLVACDDVHGAILELDMTGKQLRRWDTDSAGRKLDGGINDIVVTTDGGAYATLSGPYVDPPVAVMGEILYRAPGSEGWTVVADDFNYANGIGVSPDQKTLYVSETVGNCILKFSINADGTLSHRSNFALLNLLVPNKVTSWWLGPDSMKIDSKGDMYVAQWSGGKILKLSPEGKLLHVFEIAAGNGTTNVAFDKDETNLYVTVAKDPKDPQARGSVVRIANLK
jgi:gluconolactonase